MTRARLFLIIAPVLAVAAVFAYANRPSAVPSIAADFVIVDKSDHRLTLMLDGHVLRTYRVALGHGGLTPKRQEGDGLTPEGRYVIDGRLEHSAFHKALHISYPSPADIAAAAARRVKPGGAIMIHGMRNGLGWIGRMHTLIDWTNGCIAVSDAEMDVLWQEVVDGTPIEIRP